MRLKVEWLQPPEKWNNPPEMHCLPQFIAIMKWKLWNQNRMKRLDLCIYGGLLIQVWHHCQLYMCPESSWRHFRISTWETQLIQNCCFSTPHYQLYLDQPPNIPYKIIFVFSVQTLSLILITHPQGVWLFRNNHTPWRIRGIWLLPCLLTPQGHYLMIITSPGVALLLKCNTKF